MSPSKWFGFLRNLFYVDITSDGQKCIDDCAFRGYSYAWCNTRESWGYCTPASFLAFLSRLHSNGPGIQQPQVLANITFDNLDRDRLLVEDKDANIIDSPSVASTTTSTTPLPSADSTLFTRDPAPVQRPFDVAQFVADYDQEVPEDNTGNDSDLNAEINAASDLNAERKFIALKKKF